MECVIMMCHLGWVLPVVPRAPSRKQARQERTNRTEELTRPSAQHLLFYFSILFLAGTMRFSPVTLALLLFPAVAFAAVPDGLSEASPVVRR